jgi:Flp pilus assembly secretin CpaC
MDNPSSFCRRVRSAGSLFRLLAALCAFSGAAAPALADWPLPIGLYQLRQGQTVKFDLPGKTTRIDLGVAGVLDVYLPSPRVLEIKGEQPGHCVLVILFADGNLRHFSVQVLQAVPPAEVQKAAVEIQKNLGTITGITIAPEGPRVVIRGTAPLSSEKLYRSIVRVYGNLVVDEVKFAAAATVQGPAPQNAGAYDVFHEKFKGYVNYVLVTNTGRYQAGADSPHGSCTMVTGHYAVCQQQNGRPALVLAGK